MSRQSALTVALLGTLTAAAMGLVPAPADAAQVPVVVRKQTYNVTTFEGSYNGNPAIFALPSAQGQGRMAWWGSPDLAEEFAFAVGKSLTNFINPDQGVYFAFDKYSTFVTSAVLSLNGPGSVSELDVGQGERQIYAVLAESQPSTAVPGPLPILGSTACFVWSRRLRHRISKNRT
jgi:hypothetical protein